ncbi:MAG: neutral/alkaline ceramidase [Coxiellaceae bacterium]|nr:neutral/alkaline ceramidase [Coxiellaceae bacterium]
MSLRQFNVCVLSCLLFFSTPLLAHANGESNPYLIGAGIYDVTGPAAEIDMMGYAREEQKDSGIHSRLWSRAFIIADRQTNKRVVFVSADLGMIFQSVKQGVVSELHKKYGDLYNDNNVLLSATHTHSGPGGFAYRALFNITVMGFDKQNYNAVVNGIVQSIERAHENLQPGHILVNRGELLNANGNRSGLAYLKNPEKERARYAYNVDKTMTLLKLVGANGNAIGMINWFPVHGVSMSPKNTLISGDNKGYASYLFERQQRADYTQEKTFVAAFAQANEGDVTPNIFGQAFDGQCLTFQCGDWARTKMIGQRQYDKAQQLFDSATEEVTGPIDFRHTYIDMDHQTVAAGFADGKAEATCPSALGYSFAAGTTDGPGPSIFHQGELKGNIFIDALGGILSGPSAAQKQCQLPKPILLAVGLNKPYAWVPHNMPVQILRIGNLAILAAPGEMTTMSGRRLREQMQKVLQPEIQHVVIAGLSNSYAGYIADPDEYLQQNYEGGFTVFGRWTLPAYQQAFTRLGVALKTGKAVATGPIPEDLHAHQISMIPKVLFDDKPLNAKFGDVIVNAFMYYEPGFNVSVTFWGGDPRNNLETMQGFLEVQRLVNNQWQTVLHDWDWSTMYHWQRVGVSYSRINVIWHIDEGTPPGTYRIVHHGHYKNGWNGKVIPYSGMSQAFTVG